MVKPCVRGFGELPSDNEFDAGELSLAVDDYNPGCASFMCFPCCYNRLTLTCKVRTVLRLWSLLLLDRLGGLGTRW